MLKKRIIPVILIRDGRIVQSRLFSRYNILGDPTPAVERISSWSSDELIYLDITNQDDPYSQKTDSNKLIKSISNSCSVPLSFGGGIRNIEDAANFLKLGADKVTLNTATIDNPSLISEIALEFGSQCVVISIDVKINDYGDYEVHKFGRIKTGIHPIDHALKVQELGAGEILLNSVDRDGTGIGFDLGLINSITPKIKIPLIAIGGAGKWEDFLMVLSETDVSAVAAANIFQHSENSVYHCKDFLFRAGLPVRKPPILSSNNNIL
jgi:cyclase